MADQKISALTALTGADVDDANDELAIVDDSAGQTKKITRAQLMASVASISADAVNIGGSAYTSFSGGAIGGLVTGSTFGGLIQGQNTGHFVVGIRENNSDDSFAIVSGGGNYSADSIYDTVVAEFAADGDISFPGDTTIGGWLSLTGGDGGLSFRTRAEAIAAQAAIPTGAYFWIGDLQFLKAASAASMPDTLSATPVGDLYFDHFGAVPDYDTGTGTGTDNADAMLAAEVYTRTRDNKALHLRGRYLCSEPIVFQGFFATIISVGIGEIYFSHTSGPGIQFRKSYYKADKVAVRATSARAAASYAAINAGILTGDFDWETPASSPGASGAFGEIVNCIVNDQPGDGILAFGSGAEILRSSVASNKGHGIRVNGGDLLGLAASAVGFPGWSEVSLNKVGHNGGNAIVLDGGASSGQYPYRYKIFNNDVNFNATDAAVRLSLHQYHIIGEQIVGDQNVAGGDGPLDGTGGFYVAGRNHKWFTNRTINLAAEAFEIGEVAGYSTNDIEIDSFRVVGPTASLNPAVVIDSAITASRGVVVRNRYSANITNLVAAADIGKYAEVVTDTTQTINRAVTVTSPFVATDVTLGEFASITPTVSFSTNGDFSPTYTTQSASVMRLGEFALVQMRLVFTANAYTTASGVFLVTLPSLGFDMDATADNRCALPMTSLSRITFASTEINPALRVNSADSFRMELAASDSATVSAGTTHIPASETNVAFLASGWVRIA